MPANYTNFYETIQEARMRLRGTVILYDGEPYYVLAITNHKTDGIFRIYLDPLPTAENPYPTPREFESFPTNVYHVEDAQLGPMLDTWMTANPKGRVIRKDMNSPKFNKFRPFPLGMSNVNGSVYYCERTPNRKTEQGLIQSMLITAPLDLLPDRPALRNVKLTVADRYMRDTILGNYPTAQECIDNLQDPDVTNDAAAFSRNFAILRGPLDMLFLGYKTDVVGTLPNCDLSILKLGKKFAHVREAAEELRLFKTIAIR